MSGHHHGGHHGYQSTQTSQTDLSSIFQPQNTGTIGQGLASLFS
jgi:hypothetical protein